MTKFRKTVVVKTRKIKSKLRCDRLRTMQLGVLAVYIAGKDLNIWQGVRWFSQLCKHVYFVGSLTFWCGKSVKIPLRTSALRLAILGPLRRPPAQKIVLMITSAMISGYDAENQNRRTENLLWYPAPDYKCIGEKDQKNWMPEWIHIWVLMDSSPLGAVIHSRKFWASNLSEWTSSTVWICWHYFKGGPRKGPPLK